MSSQCKEAGRFVRKFCVECGVEFVTTRHEQMACSISCGQRHRYKNAKKRHFCKVCHKEFFPMRGSRRKNYYCGKKCFGIAKRNQMRWYGFKTCEVRAVSDGMLACLLNFSPCRYCGEMTIHTLCSKECRVAETRALTRKPHSTCQHCGTIFSRGEKSALTSCEDCKRAKEKQARKTAKYRRRLRTKSTQCESIDPSRVFERDGWRCQICKRKCIEPASGYNPKQATLDHVIPLAKGGAHIIENLQTLCQRCNTIKSDSLLTLF